MAQSLENNQKPEAKRISIDQFLMKIVHSGGWSRLLEVRQVTGSDLWQIIYVPLNSAHQDAQDIVITVTQTEYDTGQLMAQTIRNECRNYINSL